MRIVRLMIKLKKWFDSFGDVLTFIKVSTILGIEVPPIVPEVVAQDIDYTKRDEFLSADV